MEYQVGGAKKSKKILQSTANKTDWISCIENIHEIHSSWHLFVVMLVDKKRDLIFSYNFEDSVLATSIQNTTILYLMLVSVG